MYAGEAHSMMRRREEEDEKAKAALNLAQRAAYWKVIAEWKRPILKEIKQTLKDQECLSLFKLRKACVDTYSKKRQACRVQ